MGATARSTSRCLPAVLAALFVAACLAGAPAHARATGLSLGEAFGSLADKIGAGQDAGTPEAAAEPEAVDPGFVVGLGPSLPPGAEAAPAEPVAPVAPVEPAAPAEPAPDPAAPQAQRPLFVDVYAQLTGEQIPAVPGDPVSEVTQAAVGYESSGVLVWLPQSYEVIAVDEVFLAALDGDFYVDVTQIYSDFEAMGGAEHLAGFLAELAANDPTVEVFPVDEGGRAVPYANSMGTEFYAFRSVDGGECYLSLYVPTLDGRLANVWISFPEQQAAEYGEVAEFFVESLMLVEPGSDPVDIEAVSVAGRPSVTELVTENGVSFGAYGMEYDPEVEGWACYGDYFMFVTTYADYLYGETGLTEDDLYYYADELASEGGFLMAESYLANGDTVVFTYAGLSDDGFIELYGFVPMADGTVTLVAGLADAADPASLDAIAAVFQSISYADPADAQGLDAIGGSEAALGSGSDAASTAPILDVEYLSRNATLV